MALAVEKDRGGMVLRFVGVWLLDGSLGGELCEVLGTCLMW